VVEDDPEVRIAELNRQLAAQKRIAELERQLADARAAGRGDHGSEPPPSPPTQSTFAQDSVFEEHARRHRELTRSLQREGGRKELFWWVIALIGPAFGLTMAFGLPALLIAVGVFVVVVVSHIALTRRKLDAEKVIGGIMGALGGVIAVVAMLNVQFPSSVLWMSGLVCRNGYHLEYDVSHYSRAPGESTSTVDHACVSGENSYDVNDLMVWGLQAVAVVLVLSAIGAIGFAIWRRLRHRMP
jgi:hypothetical protein